MSLCLGLVGISAVVFAGFETADTLADIIDTHRSLRLEIIIVLLITFEIVIAFYQIYAARGGH